ncbi:very short patch repair endonuclease [Gaoshiqia sediminis]|uniref:Very short patch repair endonuclease n=1 Tax=Gaoshiqia sediminis TaxID=2986998 RepID=A0AA41Y594_9BACT|nr:very short patch repair endonuclease [Gaoshiqia sediminis]MCW0481357.1 very short patch repair endonuclease [Gaoshiqia sediminis]
MKNKKEYIRDGRAPVPTKEATSEVMRANKDRNTKPQLILRKALWSSGIKGYSLHWKDVPGKPDLAFSGMKLAVFVHGCFWHRCPHCNPNFPKSNIELWFHKFNAHQMRDRKKIEELKNMGRKTIVLWECKIKIE